MSQCLTHWGRVTHICVIDLTIIGSDNGLSPAQCQAIIWTNTGILFIWPSGTNFSEMLIEIHTFSFKKMHVKTSSAKRRPFCLGLNVLRAVSGAISRREAVAFSSEASKLFRKAIVHPQSHIRNGENYRTRNFSVLWRSINESMQHTHRERQCHLFHL